MSECQQALTHWHVVGCQLELAELPLALQLQQAVQRLDSSFHITDVVVVPVFMAAGVHVREDIPAAIANTVPLCPQQSFHLTSPIGQTQQFADVLVAVRDAAPTCDAWVLWGHGSRRTSFARQFEQMGQMLLAGNTDSSALTVLTAYAKQEPRLEPQIHLLYRQGSRRIGIVTGLLFPGWLSDRVCNVARSLEAELIQLHLYVSPVLMPHHLWCDAVRDLVIETLHKSNTLGQQAA